MSIIQYVDYSHPYVYAIVIAVIRHRGFPPSFLAATIQFTGQHVESNRKQLNENRASGNIYLQLFLWYQNKTFFFFPVESIPKKPHPNTAA